MDNLILCTDSYKFSHYLQYPPGTSYMFSYIESRGGHYEETVFFGLRYILQKYFTKPITQEDVEEAAKFAAAHGEPFPYEGWKKVVNVHGGMLPLRIRAVQEGSVVLVKNVLVTVESTDPELFWMVSWMETMLMQLWYPITVATKSYHIKSLILEYLRKTSDNPEAEINFKLHDFGYRGVSSQESAEIGGMAHLVNFMGSDTVAGVWAANKYYKMEMSGFSIPAAEHSTITSWGKDYEGDAYTNMVKQFGKPGSLVAVVSDSYNIYEAVEKIWCSTVMQDIIKEKGCTLIIRPDSGDPATTIMRLLLILDKKLTMTVNSKGFKVLPSNIRLIQGDGVDESSIQEILSTMARAGYSASNIAFGMGGALLQKVNRDTQEFAMKCSAVMVDGKLRDVYKQPVGQSMKNSKKGLLDLIKVNGQYQTINKISGQDSELQLVYENGEIFNQNYNLTDIRNRVDSHRAEQLAKRNF